MSKKRKAAEQVAATSADLVAERREQLAALFPEAFSEGKVDSEKLRAALGDLVEGGAERYSFTWAGKRDAIRLLQTPSRATLIPCPEESVNFDTTQHLFIEGDNLEVLKLLYKSYAGRVKMIYIDPPYNTGNDFIYPDNFADPLDVYLQFTGQRDTEGNLLTSNPETSGRYHSSWLSMMYPRLFIARQLLREDGVIFVSIDDHEAFDLRLLMNEVFGEENFVAQLVWKSRQFPDSRAVTGVSTDHEYIVVYTRSSERIFRGVERDETKFSNPDSDARGPWMSRSLLGLATKEQRPNLHYDIVDPQTGISYSPAPSTGWRYSQERMNELIAHGRILFPPTPDGRPREKKFRADLANEFTSFPTITDDVFTAHGTAEIRELFGFQAFDFPKPSELVRRFVEQTTSDDDIVLDPFAGSATTAHAVKLQNRMDGGRRRCICVQLPEPVPEGSEASRRGFQTIADIGKERIRRVIKKLEEQAEGELGLNAVGEKPEDLGFKVFRLTESHHRRWRGVEEKEPEALADEMEAFTDPLVPGWKPINVVYEVLLKEGLSLTSRIEELPKKAVKKNKVYRVTDDERGQSLLICLDDKLDPGTPKALGLGKDDVFVCRDAALTDESAANLALQCRLKTI